MSLRLCETTGTLHSPAFVARAFPQRSRRLACLERLQVVAEGVREARVGDARARIAARGHGRVSSQRRGRNPPKGLSFFSCVKQGDVCRKRWLFFFSVERDSSEVWTPSREETNAGRYVRKIYTWQVFERRASRARGGGTAASRRQFYLISKVRTLVVGVS